jgi:hypothetical protein
MECSTETYPFRHDTEYEQEAYGFSCTWHTFDTWVKMKAFTTGK